MKKVEIALDADVIIHFSKGGRLHMLPKVLPEYDFVVLEVVRDELRGAVRQELDRQEAFLSNIRIIEFEPQDEMLHEYLALTATRGRGESACMAYCRFSNNVIGSSNLRDIQDYCLENKIIYLTSLDFLYYAYINKLMTKKECDEFINLVNAKDSKLPVVDITQYKPHSFL